MAIYSYRMACGQTRWMFVIDLPPAADGKRRQMCRKGFRSQDAALVAETKARQAYGRADLSADGSLAAELENWLTERQLDLQPTTLSNYRDIIGYIKPHLGSRHAYTLDKRAIHDLYLTLLKRGSKRGKPLAQETVRTVHRVLMKALKGLATQTGCCSTASRKKAWITPSSDCRWSSPTAHVSSDADLRVPA